MRVRSYVWVEMEGRKSGAARAAPAAPPATAMWCDGTLPESTKSTRDGKKRKSDDSTDEPPSKCKANEGTVDEITKTLQEKHGETWSTPQYRLWAQIKHNGQHSCLDTPPSIPMFSGTTSKPPRRESLSDAITSAATAVVGLIKGNDSTSAALSPGNELGSLDNIWSIWKNLDIYMSWEF